jgi:hypothetical protein
MAAFFTRHHTTAVYRHYRFSGFTKAVRVSHCDFGHLPGFQLLRWPHSWFNPGCNRRVDRSFLWPQRIKHNHHYDCLVAWALALDMLVSAPDELVSSRTNLANVVLLSSSLSFICIWPI